MVHNRVRPVQVLLILRHNRYFVLDQQRRVSLRSLRLLGYRSPGERRGRESSEGRREKGCGVRRNVGVPNKVTIGKDM